MIVLLPDQITKADAYIDQQYTQYDRLGGRLFQTFGYDRRSGRVSAQVRNLQQIVCSATRFADIEDFVKNQMGKGTESAQDWRKMGDDVLEQLRHLRDEASRNEAPPEVQLALRLRLARGWVRAVVSAYLFRVAKDQMEATHA